MSKIKYELFHERLANELVIKGLSQAQFSRLSGVPTTSLNEYIRKNRIPPLDKVEKLATALGVSPCYLAGWSDEKQDI